MVTLTDPCLPVTFDPIAPTVEDYIITDPLVTLPVPTITIANCGNLLTPVIEFDATYLADSGDFIVYPSAQGSLYSGVDIQTDNFVFAEKSYTFTISAYLEEY